jgi:hypothetical protein
MYGFNELSIMIPALMLMSIESVIRGYNIGVYVWNVSNIGCVRSAIMYSNIVLVWFGFLVFVIIMIGIVIANIVIVFLAL